MSMSTDGGGVNDEFRDQDIPTDQFVDAFRPDVPPDHEIVAHGGGDHRACDPQNPRGWPTPRSDHPRVPSCERYLKSREPLYSPGVTRKSTIPRSTG